MAHQNSIKLEMIGSLRQKWMLKRNMHSLLKTSRTQA